MKYFINKDGKEVIDPKLVDTEAKKYAKEFVVLDKSIKSSQLRKFYGTVKALELELKNRTHGKGDKESQEAVFGEILPLIKLLKAKGAYARARMVVPEAFKAWLDDNVDTINEPREFEAFLLHFEAVVGFCYGLGLKD